MCQVVCDIIKGCQRVYIIGCVFVSGRVLKDMSKGVSPWDAYPCPQDLISDVTSVM